MLSRNGLQDVGCKVWSICRKSHWLKLGRAFEDSFFPGKGGGRGGGGQNLNKPVLKSSNAQGARENGGGGFEASN